MPNPEHVSILTQGADLWNFWRNECTVGTPDLSNTDLSQLNLEAVDLTACNCSGANFHSAYLASAILMGANLSACNFSEANLSNSYFNDANLIGANLTQALLRNANLHGADVRYVDFSFSVLSGVGFTNLDLSLSEGLGSCLHINPSRINDQTLERSGNLVSGFLEGVGLMPWEIEHNRLAKSRLDNL